MPVEQQRLLPTRDPSPELSTVMMGNHVQRSESDHPCLTMEFPAISDGGLLQSTLHSEKGIYKKHAGQLSLHT